ncbi:alkaline phosphatase family protein [Paenibacillus oenotherae]|uniref:Alkaline phosphatase family protein n=1 Tax=Paenibacillus oenotherae TaxID=1435645 RepID=A0ABS7DB20_9BACL|nr:alkaline phosphatase family protein [Paenibacillus oenotherae]MBW7477085.1 alkaline phosphatase family protein [Paenibacillus oenotherae]
MAAPGRIGCAVWLLALLLLSGCSGGNKEEKERDLLHIQSEEGTHAKKVILILVDSLMYEAIDRGIAQQKLPTLKYLIDNGQYYKDIVSSFPTMSVTIDSSLMTGTYPDQHHIPGLAWYNADTEKDINYGTGPMEIMRKGVKDVVWDGLLHLNSRDLSPAVSTIYEELSRKGLKSGSINGLIYRGPVEHTIEIPAWLGKTVSLPESLTVKGPDYLSFGSLSNPLDGLKQLPDSLANRMGFNNEFAVETAAYLIRNNKLPDFLYVYLPDLDQELHKKGPSSMKGLVKLDKQLHDLLQAFGSPDKARSQATVMIVGDSGMSQLRPAREHSVIELTTLYSGYSSLRPGDRVTKDTELVFAVNETMAYVYKLHTKASMRQLADVVEADQRVDLIAWKEDGWIHVTKGGAQTAFQYKPGGKIVDQYGQAWTVSGDAALLDMHMKRENNGLRYGQYPDALRRIYGALTSHKGQFLVVTAKEGYELKGHSSPTHEGGGGHGSLHETESLIPFIVWGAEEKLASRRVVDIKAYIERILMHP